MPAKISDELFKLVNEAIKTDPQRTIPVIITITKNTNLNALKQEGLKIQQIFENIPAVSGIITAAAINKIAQLDQIEIIEYDGEVRAL